MLMRWCNCEHITHCSCLCVLVQPLSINQHQVMWTWGMLHQCDAKTRKTTETQPPKMTRTSSSRQGLAMRRQGQQVGCHESDPPPGSASCVASHGGRQKAERFPEGQVKASHRQHASTTITTPGQPAFIQCLGSRSCMNRS